ncbi:hypothetical protein ACGFNU_35195 [Spirillospora sp. NPDC048911]|uniref:hypothetical protein n=1 Tax=Spirillospora sp. NPDC048911 TaxID=3364527 RepID=UPI00371E23D0
MRQIKIHTGAVLATGLIAGLAGCGSSNAGESRNGPPKPDHPANSPAAPAGPSPGCRPIPADTRTAGPHIFTTMNLYIAPGKAR